MKKLLLAIGFTICLNLTSAYATTPHSEQKFKASCDETGPNGEYTIALQENASELVIDWDALISNAGNGFTYLDYWVNGSYKGSYPASINYDERIFGINNISDGDVIEFFFKYDRPGGQYIGSRNDHRHVFGSCTADQDADGDGFTADEDCDDNDASVNPDAVEICDGIDNNCDGQIDEGLLSEFFVDEDGDGYGDTDQPVMACELGDGLASVGGDCQDRDSKVNPGAEERCDGFDNNCDGQIDESGDPKTWYADNDFDGYGDPDNSEFTCRPPSQFHITFGGDCDDNNNSINPGASEVCDELDNDCNDQIDDGLPTQTFYADEDGDGFGKSDDVGAVQSCLPELDGHVLNDDDCNDASAAINPDAEEVCDELDNNCDGQIDEGVQTQFWIDEDRDGWGGSDQWVWACENPSTTGSLVDRTGDCNDDNEFINPDMDEILGNGIDDNCNGEVDEGSDCVVENPNGEYTLTFSELGNLLIIDWDALIPNAGNGFTYLDYWVNGTYQGSYPATVNYADRVFGINNLNMGDVVEFFFKYDRPGGQYIGVQGDHTYTMGSCVPNVAKNRWEEGFVEDLTNTRLWPNPVTEVLYVETDSKLISNISIISNTGVESIMETINSVAASVDVSALPEGVYTVKVETNFGVHMAKFVKQ